MNRLARKIPARSKGRKPLAGIDVAELIKMAYALQSQGNIDDARKYLDQVLRVEPGNPDAVHLISLGLLRQLRNTAAFKFLRKWATHPNSANASTQYYIAYSYFVVKRYRLAHQHLQRALELEPDKVVARLLMAQVLINLDRSDDALSILRQDPVIQSAAPEDRKSYARVLADLKQYPEAKKVLTTLLQDDIYPIDSVCDLIDLPPETWSQETCKQVNVLLELPDLSVREKALLHSAAGRIADHEARYGEAYHHFSESKNHSARRFNYAVFRDAARVCMNNSVPETNRKPDLRPPHAGVTPLFIVGLPRSGKTLLEKLLSLRPEFAACGEVQCRTFIDADLFVGFTGEMPDQYDATLKKIKSTQSKMYASEYVEGILDQYSLPKPTKFIVNTMPHNCFNIRALYLIFPYAKFIYIRRNIKDLFIFNMMKNFKLGFGFTRNFDSFNQYYNLIEELMSHWQDRADSSLLTIDYADLVKSPDLTIRQVQEFLDVEPLGDTTSAPCFEEIGMSDKYIDYWKHYSEFFPPSGR
ncbi:MAG: tetratricopeptide repeat-containing sulfotransferase family protein [Anderseniella sp.]